MQVRLIAVALLVLAAGCSTAPAPIVPAPMSIKLAPPPTPVVTADMPSVAAPVITIEPVAIQPQVVDMTNDFIVGPAAGIPVQGAFAFQYSSEDHQPVLTIGLASGTP